MKHKVDTAERKRTFSRLFWDYSVSWKEVERILSDKNSKNEKEKIFLRLLMSANWYTLLGILTPAELREAMSVHVLNRIHIVTLREKYFHARRLLF